MSIEETRRWIQEHKRHPNSQARWDAALENTRICASAANRVQGSGIERLNTYYNCRRGKKVTVEGLFNVKPSPGGSLVIFR